MGNRIVKTSIVTNENENEEFDFELIGDCVNNNYCKRTNDCKCKIIKQLLDIEMMRIDKIRDL
jgi:hypothetical protein